MDILPALPTDSRGWPTIIAICADLRAPEATRIKVSVIKSPWREARSRASIGNARIAAIRARRMPNAVPCQTTKGISIFVLALYGGKVSGKRSARKRSSLVAL